MNLQPAECENLHGTDCGDRGHLSPSSISTQLSCLEKFRWSYVDRLELNVRPVSLSLGDAFAKALDAADPQVGFDRIIAERDKLIDEHDGNPFVVLPTMEQTEIDATIVLAASGAYLERYGSHAETREVELRVRLRNPQTGAYSRTFDLVCRVDALSPDGRTLVEDKLVSQIPRVNADRYVALDRQVTINCYTAWRASGVAPAEIKYRWTMKPGIRRKQNESHDGYLKRIVADYLDRPDFYMHEATPSRTPDDFLRLEAELWQWAAARREAMHAGVFPRNTSSCDAYGGCRYLAACTREPGFESQFHVRAERDVTKVDESESQEAVTA